MFANNQGSYGYQLDAVLVEKAGNSPQPLTMNGIRINGSNVTMAGANGLAGGVYRILSSTNLSTPLSMWTPIATNYFSGSGGFSFTNPVTTGVPAMFYQVVSP